MKKESFESKVWRWLGNWFPAYRGSGAKVIYVSSDFEDVMIKLPFNWRTKNHMGMIWGGSLYAALDPIYAVMLYKLLGYRYRVIDSEAQIRFLRPSKETLFAHFHIPKADLQALKVQLSKNGKARMNLDISLRNSQGIVHATCYKQIYITHS